MFIFDFFVCFLMLWRPTKSTRTCKLVPYTALVRSMLRPSRWSSSDPFGRVRSGARRLRQAGAKPKKLPPRKPYRNAPELISGAPGGEINFYSNKDDEKDRKSTRLNSSH